MSVSCSVTDSTRPCGSRRGSRSAGASVGFPPGSVEVGRRFLCVPLDLLETAGHRQLTYEILNVPTSVPEAKSRRVSVVAAAPALVPATALGRRAPANSRIQVGCIGVGPQGRGVMGNFLGQDQCRVVAVCDVAKRNLNEALGQVNAHYADHACATYHHYQRTARTQRHRCRVDRVARSLACRHGHRCRPRRQGHLPGETDGAIGRRRSTPAGSGSKGETDLSSSARSNVRAASSARPVNSSAAARSAP
jgi:hypothetical protein